MKVYICFKPKDEVVSFEGTRLRKTLKGACEVVDISWVDTPQEDVKIAHFMSPKDLAALRQQKEKGVATVVSAFYAEDDPEAGFLTSEKGDQLKPKALMMLNEADLVLVPNEAGLELARRVGVTSHIEILEPAVRMNRFSKRSSEAKIFRRYFGVRPGVKTVVATGSYADRKTISFIKSIARNCPNLDFYFFGAHSRYDVLKIAKSIARVRRSSNLHFKDAVQDDVYRSALMDSVAYISNDSLRPDPIAPLEAFASKTQVVAIASPNPNPLLVEGTSCFFFPSPEAIAKYLDSLNYPGAKSTIDTAYAIAKAHNLVSYGTTLKGYYEALLASGAKR